MNDDEIAILYYLYLNGGATTSEIAKELFEPEDTSELRNHDRRVRHYLEDNNQRLLNVKKVDGKKRFSIDEDKIFFGIGKINVVTLEQDEVSLGLGNVMVYKNKEGGYSVATFQSRD